MSKIQKVKFVVVDDNKSLYPYLTAEWGFACVIHSPEKTILFDSGADSTTLLANMVKLEESPEKVDSVFLSHDHWDHTGGLRGFLTKHSNVKVFILESFSSELKHIIREVNAGMEELSEKTRLAKQVYSTGEMGGSIREQSMVVKTAKGLVIITGCAHPGIDNILEYVVENFRGSIYMVLGGVHLGGYKEKFVKDIISQFRKHKVQKVALCHCTGDKALRMFKNEFGDDFIGIGVGSVIEI